MIGIMKERGVLSGLEFCLNLLAGLVPPATLLRVSVVVREAEAALTVITCL